MLAGDSGPDPPPFRGRRQAGGQRYFDLYEDEVVTLPNPLRWFLIPALMFLLGSLGCFFISFRWR